MFVKFHISIK